MDLLALIRGRASRAQRQRQRVQPVGLDPDARPHLSSRQVKDIKTRLQRESSGESHPSLIPELKGHIWD